MKKLLKHSAAVLAGIGFVSAAVAQTTNIDITGKVVASECVATVVGNSGTTVDLGTIQGSDLLNVGDSSTEIPFKIEFTNCPATTTGYKATFTGTPADEDPLFFKNSEDAGAAKRVQIRVINAATNKSVLADSGVYSAPGSLSGSGVLNLKANAITSQGNTIPGDIRTTVTLTVEYTGG